MALAATSCSEDDYPPIPESDHALVEQVTDLLMCGANANDTPTELPTFTGEVRSPEAIQCLRDLLDRDRVYALPDSDIPSACRGVLAIGCTSQDGHGCGDDEVFIPEGLIPPDLVSMAEGGALYEQSSVDLGSVLYHEAIHTVQAKYDCRAQREVEAYDNESRYDGWLNVQLGLIAPDGPDPCPTPLEDLEELSSCLLDFIGDAFPEADLSEPLPSDVCDDVMQLRDRAGRLWAERGSSRGTFEAEALNCNALTAASSNIRFPSEQWPMFVAVIPDDNIVYQFEVQPDGSNELVRTYNPGFQEVRDLRIIRDAQGADVLLVAGIDDGDGAVAASRDVPLGGEFGSADGLFDENIVTLTSENLQEASEFVHAGTSSLLVFDRPGQAAYEILIDAGGEPSDLVDDPAILVPLFSDAASLVHEPDRPTAYAKLRFADSANATRLLQFDDLDGDGRYSFVAEGTAHELGRLPPGFLTTPVAGAWGVWVSGGIDHTIELAPSNPEGEMGEPIGSGVVPAAGQLWLETHRPLLLDETVRVRDVTSELNGVWTEVLPDRLQAHFYEPHWGPEDGGTTIFVRGQGFSSLETVKIEGEPVEFEVVDDTRLRVTTPPGTGVARMVASTDKETRELGSFRYTPPERDKRWDTAGEFSAWYPDALAGWTCGPGVIALASEPPSGDRDGCRFLGRPGRWGHLESPIIYLSGTGRLFLRVEHTSDFGTDGDGVVVQIGDGAEWYSPSAIARSERRLDGASCRGSGSGRTCLADPPAHGARGDSGTAANRNWRVDLYELPAVFDTASWLRIRFAASNMSTASGAGYQLGSVELVSTEHSPAETYARWMKIADIVSGCGGVPVTGRFECTASPLPGAVGDVLRYSDARADSTGTVSLPFSAPAGKRVSAVFRHAVDLTAGPRVGTGLGRIRVCCGSASCTTLAPLDGYPPVAPGTAPGFGDEGPEGVWMTDEVDLSAWAGAGSCALQFFATGACIRQQPGWLIDTAIVRVR